MIKKKEIPELTTRDKVKMIAWVVFVVLYLAGILLLVNCPGRPFS